MSNNAYIVGQTIFLQAYLTDPSTGDADDPATQDPVDDPTIAMTVYLPDGTTVNASLSHVSTGTYTSSITASIPGEYKYFTLATGAATGAGKGRFYAQDVP